MRLFTYFRAGLFTTLNIFLNALTLGRFVWLEGRVRRGVFRNWGRGFRYRPADYLEPTSEQQIVDLVQKAKRVRLFGSAHSFNAGVVVDGTLVSLDKYSGIISRDREKHQVTVKGGTRVRDVVAALLEDGLAFEALPSHDAQSIGGILSTDVHGTGKTWGWVSGSVVSLKVLTGQGETIECYPVSDLFKAAIGGVGAVGIILEVVIQGVPRFDVRQEVETGSLAAVEKNLSAIVDENEHCSLYLFPFTDKCQINTWNRAKKPKTTLGPLWEFLSISADALLAAWAAGLLAYTRLLPLTSTAAHSIKKGTSLVLESHAAFNRTIYHLHQELEFTVPFEDTFGACKQFLKLYEDMYRQRALPYLLLEVRFTPAGHDRTLIGAGRDRRSTWIDLIMNDSAGFESYYAAAEHLLMEMKARPHLGKFCKTLDHVYLARTHGAPFEEFQALVKQHDPDGRFSNEFTRRVVGPS